MRFLTGMAYVAWETFKFICSALLFGYIGGTLAGTGGMMIGVLAALWMCLK